MTTTPVTPEILTFDHIKSWDGQTMKDQMHRSPEMRAAIYEVIRTKSLADVEAAQAAIDARQTTDLPTVETPPEEIVVSEEQRVAAEAEAQRVAAEQAEVARIAALPKKFVADYQVKDEDGNAIGRPTHLEAATEEELRGKIIEAHIQATRAFHRLKKQKVSFKDQQPQPIVPAQSSDAELLAFMKDLKSDDPQKQLDAVRKVQKVEADRVKAEADQKTAELNELRRQEKVSYDFLVRHQKDFNNCQANIELVKGYFEENQLAWTSDNLEIAFHALESELAPVAVPVPPTPPVNPVPVVPEVVPPTPAAIVAVQPPTPATVQTVVPANPVPPARRPGVNGSLEPGQNSGVRPAAAAPKGLTVEEVKSWDGPTMRAKMRNPAIRAQIEAFAAARNKR
jgi:hypothetical protein